MVAQLQQYSIGFIVLGIGMLVQGSKRADVSWLVGGIILLLIGVVLPIYVHRHDLAAIVTRSLYIHKGKGYDEPQSTINSRSAAMAAAGTEAN